MVKKNDDTKKFTWIRRVYNRITGPNNQMSIPEPKLAKTESPLRDTVGPNEYVDEPISTYQWVVNFSSLSFEWSIDLVRRSSYWCQTSCRYIIPDPVQNTIDNWFWKIFGYPSYIQEYELIKLQKITQERIIKVKLQAEINQQAAKLYKFVQKNQQLVREQENQCRRWATKSQSVANAQYQIRVDKMNVNHASGIDPRKTADWNIGNFEFENLSTLCDELECDNQKTLERKLWEDELYMQREKETKARESLQDSCQQTCEETIDETLKKNNKDWVNSCTKHLNEQARLYDEQTKILESGFKISHSGQERIENSLALVPSTEISVPELYKPNHDPFIKYGNLNTENGPIGPLAPIGPSSFYPAPIVTEQLFDYGFFAAIQWGEKNVNFFNLMQNIIILPIQTLSRRSKYYQKNNAPPFTGRIATSIWLTIVYITIYNIIFFVGPPIVQYILNWLEFYFKEAAKKRKKEKTKKKSKNKNKTNSNLFSNLCTTFGNRANDLVFKFRGGHSVVKNSKLNIFEILTIEFAFPTTNQMVNLGLNDPIFLHVHAAKIRLKVEEKIEYKKILKKEQQTSFVKKNLIRIKKSFLFTIGAYSLSVLPIAEQINSPSLMNKPVIIRSIQDKIPDENAIKIQMGDSSTILIFKPKTKTTISRSNRKKTRIKKFSDLTPLPETMFTKEENEICNQRIKIPIRLKNN